MTSHVGLMALFSFFVALVFAVIAQDTPREQAMVFLRFFGAFLAAGLVLGWLMLPLPL